MLLTHTQLTLFFTRIEELGGRVLYASSPSPSTSLDKRRCHLVSSLFRSLQKFWPRKLSTVQEGDGDDYDTEDDEASAVVETTQRYVYDTCVVVDCAQWLDAMAACTKVGGYCSFAKTAYARVAVFLTFLVHFH